MDYNKLLKFNVNDEVWLMNNNKPTKSRIESICITCEYFGGTIVSYRLPNSINWYNSKDLYKTKQELIEYISNV